MTDHHLPPHLDPTIARTPDVAAVIEVIDLIGIIIAAQSNTIVELHERLAEIEDLLELDTGPDMINVPTGEHL